MKDRKYKKEYKLTKEQEEVLVGIILSDGYLERGKISYNTRLRIEHTYPKQESYVRSLYELYKPLVSTEPKIIERKADPRTGKVYKTILGDAQHP